MRRISSVKFIYLFSFFVNLFMGMVFLGIPLFALKLNAGNIALGLLGANSALVYILLVPFSGWLSGRISKNLQAGLGAMIFGASICLAPFINHFFWIFILQIFYMGGMALVWPAVESGLGHFGSGKALARSAGWFNVSWSSGAMIGYYLAGLIFQLKPNWVFFSAGGLSVMFGVMFALLFKLPKPLPEGPESSEDNAEYLLYLCWLANGMIYFVFNILRNIFPKFAVELEISSANIGLLLFILSLAQGLWFLILNLTERWHHKFFPIALSMLSTFLGLIIIGFSGSLFGFALGFFLIGSSGGMAYFASLYYAIGLKSGLAGTRSAWHEFYLGLGALSGPLLGGVLAHSFGLRSPYLVSAGLVIMVLMVQILSFIFRANFQKTKQN